jgi:LemA protein
MQTNGPDIGSLLACLIPLAAAVVVVAVPFLIYNSLVSLRNMLKESWSDVDTELKRRYDLIPNLVETVKGYAAHEREVLEQVALARAAAAADHGPVAHQSETEQALQDSLGRLFAVAERYPDLKASANFLELQKELANTENRIQAARRFYNSNVRDYNTRCQMFPSSIIAGMFRFEPADFFRLRLESEREAPRIEWDQRPPAFN